MQQLNKKESKQLFKQVRKNLDREREVVLLLENIQYARNVAGIFRTADAAGITKMMLTGISQQPPFGKDLRKASRTKEDSVHWEYHEHTGKILNTLKKKGYKIIAVEITDNATPISELPAQISEHSKICLVMGSEVYGITKPTLAKCDYATYIPMFGKGASLNVGVSAGIALYFLQLADFTLE